MSNKKRKTTEVEFEYTGIEDTSDVPSDVTIVRFHSSVTEVGDLMFRHCKMNEVVFNEGLLKIGSGSFSLCSKLEHINLPSTLIEIGNEAFCACYNVKSVLLNEGLETIGMAAFASCSSLESITIPPTVTEIRDRTFSGCLGLREVGLHEGIQKIESSIYGFQMFGGCSSLERFTFLNLSTRLDNIIQAGEYVDVEDKIDNIRGPFIERRGSELFSASLTPWRVDIWKRVKEALGQIDHLITYYELREATTLLELAMWKSKIDQASTNGPINGDEYRIDIPGPVKNNILSYLNFRV